jgi:hypothetical protein
MAVTRIDHVAIPVADVEAMGGSASSSSSGLLLDQSSAR